MSLEDCEKFYLEEFKKLLFNKNFKYPKIFISNNNEDYSYLFDKFQFDNTHAINYPLMIPNENKDEFYRFYKLLQTGDKILIWNDQFNVGHLTIQIITKYGYIFSIGAFSNHSYESALNTPDARFERSLIKKCLNPTLRTTKLIAISELNNKHIRLINEIFNSITINNNHKHEYMLYSFSVNNIFIDTINQINAINRSNIKKLTAQNNNTILMEIGDDIPNEKANNVINNIRQYITENPPKFLCTFPFLLFDWKEKQFCVFSRKGGRTINCASFVQYIFDDIISCTGSSIVTIPGMCHQKKTSKRVTCPKVVSNTSRKT